MGPTIENSEVLFEKDLGIIIERIKCVWHHVFRGVPNIEVYDEGILIDHALDLRPETISITRKTIAGVKTREVDGWGVYIWQPQRGLPDTPEDVQEAEVGQRQLLDDALILLTEVVARDLAKIALENH